MKKDFLRVEIIFKWGTEHLEFELDEYCTTDIIGKLLKNIVEELQINGNMLKKVEYIEKFS